MAEPFIKMPGDLLFSTNNQCSKEGWTVEHATWLRKPGNAALVEEFMNDLMSGEVKLAQTLETEQVEYFTPLADIDVPEKYQVTLAKYRKLAIEHDVEARASVCYRVKAGFTLKKHAPKAGPCYENYGYLQDWNFPDEATEDCLAFWVPCIVRGSTSKTKDKQAKMLSSLRAKLELSAHHMSVFGKVGLLAGLILAHFKATGERIPLNKYWVRTDTCDADGDRLSLGWFDGTGLRCNDWDFDDDALDDVGVFPLGVEALVT